MMEISKEVNSERNYTIMTAVLCWAGMVVMSKFICDDSFNRSIFRPF